MLRQFSRNSHKRFRVPVSTTTAIPPVGLSGSVSSPAFTSSRQDISPHYSWWNRKYTDFYYSWTPALRDWAARHNDVQISGDAGSFLTGSANITGQHQKYGLLWSTGKAGGQSGSTANSFYVNMASWYNNPAFNTTGATEESAYLHYLSGSIIYKSLKYPTNIAVGTPAVVTIPAHGYANGSLVNCSLFTPSGVPSGNYIITVIDANNFSVPATCTTAKINTGQCSDKFGDGTKTYANRLVRNQIFPPAKTTTWADEWMMNFETSASHQYHISRSLEICSGLEKGIFWDETDAQEEHQGYPSVEYPINGGYVYGSPASGDYKRMIDNMRTLINEISASITPKQQWLNPASYYTFADERSLASAAGYAHLETTNRCDTPNDTYNMGQYQAWCNIAGKPGFEMVSFLSWTDAYNGFNTSGSSGAYSSKINRGKAAEWIAAWISMPGDSNHRANVFINTSNYWSYPTTTDWLPMWERDIGLPIVPTFSASIALNINRPRADNTTFWSYDTSSLNTIGVKSDVRARETDKALILYRHCPADADNTGGATKIASQSRNESPAIINLPPTNVWGLLDESGSYGPPITSVSMNGGEGVILMKRFIESHEPLNYTTIQDWTGRDQGAWLKTVGSGVPVGNAGPWTWAYDPDFNDTVTVLQYGPWNVPAGQSYGGGDAYIPIPGTYKSFYLSFQIKLSSNWVQNPSHDQKIFQFLTNSSMGGNVCTILYGADGNMKFMMYENNSAQPDRDGVPLGQNPTGKFFVLPPLFTFTLGQVHTVEVLVGGNTPGKTDGWFRTYVDGQLLTQVSDMQWVPNNVSGNLYQFQIFPVWGGQGGSLSTAQYMSLGKIHLSGITSLTPCP